MNPRRLSDYASMYRRNTLVNPIIIFVSDFERCCRFDRHVFHLRLLHKTGDWAELDAGGFVLSIHGGYKGPANRHQRPLGLHFVCKDLDRSMRLVRQYGGKVGCVRMLDVRPDASRTATEVG